MDDTALRQDQRYMADDEVPTNMALMAFSDSKGHPQKEDQGYVDSGCLRHMTRNMSFLSDFKELDGGYVTFMGGVKGGKITGKGTLKTAEEDRFLLKVPRKNNMYSVDMKNIILKESLTFLVAKVTLDESMLWHKRLGHVKFKTINKLVKENLVRGLPTKRFKNDQTCVACPKGKQHKASFDKKVKIIRCDNGTEFKNRVISEFCEKKGIKKEFSVARTPQKNGVAKRRNRTLIEATRTIIIGARHSSKEIGSSQDYILMPLWKDGSLFDSSSKNASNDEPQPPSDAEKKDDEGVCKESRIADQEKPKNSTQDVNNARPSINVEPYMFSLLDNATLEATHADFFGDKTKVDMSNITTTYPILSTLNTRNHKDHSLDHVIGDVQSEVEPKKVIQALTDPKWIEAINKARLVAQGYTQEEGIDYDVVFAPVARIEAIRLFLAYASFMNFVVYQMDVNSAFLYGKIEEEVYVMQKEDGIFISQDKYVDEILKKFGFSTVRIASTPMETSKPLLKDAEAEDVDVHLYRSMIGSLMYLTTFRPNIMFVVCVCAIFQVTPKVSHLHAVKRIFRYLKGQPKLDLWYPKDSPFNLEAYFDSDYAGGSLYRKSTTGGCQFLGSRLILWQCKKQTIIANSTTEAEYVAAANCCGQVLWIQNQMLDYGYNFMNTKIFIDNESTICIVKNPVFHLKTTHIKIRHHFIRDSYEKRLIQVIKIHTDHNVADLLTKALDVSHFQFLTASIGMLNL
ncbi:putative ribonuclease H-like domain-containing protein [Tanacetum coccineum]